jgi:3-mercaptopyruvate sulfurtransferase SseA
MLEKLGVKGVKVLDGGYRRWLKLGYEVEEVPSP